MGSKKEVGALFTRDRPGLDLRPYCRRYYSLCNSCFIKWGEAWKIEEKHIIFMMYFNIQCKFCLNYLWILSFYEEPSSVSACDNVTQPDEFITVKINDSETWYSKNAKFVSLAEIFHQNFHHWQLKIITHLNPTALIEDKSGVRIWTKYY